MTDTALARLVATALAGNRQEVVVVNPDAADVGERVKALGVEAERVRVVDGWDCVEEFVTAETQLLSATLALEVFADKAVNPDRPIAVGWHERWGAVTGAHIESDGTLVLTIDHASHSLSHPAPRQHSTGSGLVSADVDSR